MGESAEHYLKTILTLCNRHGAVRSVDVAHELGVSRPSVSNAVKKLRESGLVEMNESRRLLLTDKGLARASSILERHAEIERFLTQVLEVDGEIAHSDSCHLEHCISTETFEKIKQINEYRYDFEKLASRKAYKYYGDHGTTGTKIGARTVPTMARPAGLSGCQKWA